MAGAGRIKGAIRTELDGLFFDSRREARRWAILSMMAKAKPPLISDLKRQVKIPLHGRDGPILTLGGKQMTYVADFTYTDAKTGAEVVEDAKGHKTEKYLMKKAILAAQGVTIREV